MIAAADDAGLSPTANDGSRPVFRSFLHPAARAANPFGDMSGLDKVKTALAQVDSTVTPTVKLSGTPQAIAELTQIYGSCRVLGSFDGQCDVGHLVCKITIDMTWKRLGGARKVSVDARRFALSSCRSKEDKDRARGRP